MTLLTALGIRHQRHGPVPLLEHSVPFEGMVEQNVTGNHTIVPRLAKQRQNLQPAVSRMWKDEPTKTGQLLR
jgi:hypothetical protein